MSRASERARPVPPGRIRRVLLLVLFLASVAGLSWSLTLALTEGVRFDLWGIRITSHDARRPLLLGAIALALYQLLGGSLSLLVRAAAPLTRIRPGAVAAAAAVVTLAWAVAHSTMSAGGADSYGYVSQAELWRRGDTVQEQSWAHEAPWSARTFTFAPLGYRPSTDGNAIVPIYAPGLPLLMAGAQSVFGHCAAFLISPVAAGLLVWLTFVFGRAVTGDWVAAGAAILVAASPTVAFMSVQPMSDVPTAAAWLAACCLLLRSTRWSALASGLAASAAVMMRPNLVVLLVVPAGWLLWRALTTSGDARRWAKLPVWIAGTLPGVTVAFALNAAYYGSAVGTGYGDLDTLFSVSHVGTNVRQYAEWALGAEHVLMLPALGLLMLPLPKLWGDRVDLTVLMGAFTAVIVTEYLLYIPFDDWWYLRFLLPAWPFLMIASSFVLGRLVMGRLIWYAVALALLLASNFYITGGSLHSQAFSMWRSEYRYAAVADHVQAATSLDSVFLSHQHSGSLRYYGGRLTMRFDWLETDQLDAALDWLESRGTHPYLLVDEWEVPVFLRRFAGQAALDRLARPPVIRYRGEGVVYLFDLASSGSPVIPTSVVEDYSAPRCHLPAPGPAPALRPRTSSSAIDQ